MKKAGTYEDTYVTGQPRVRWRYKNDEGKIVREQAHFMPNGELLLVGNKDGWKCRRRRGDWEYFKKNENISWLELRDSLDASEKELAGAHAAAP